MGRRARRRRACAPGAAADGATWLATAARGPTAQDAAFAARAAERNVARIVLTATRRRTYLRDLGREVDKSNSCGFTQAAPPP